MIQFIKKNWGWLFIVLILIFFNYLYNSLFSTDNLSSISLLPETSSISLSSSKSTKSMDTSSSSTDRIIIQNNGLSLKVKDVSDTINKIENTAKKFGGFLVNSRLSKPEDSVSGNITVRIPEDKRQEAMDSFKNMAVKVVSESVEGVDVTDQYNDLDASLEVLLKTKVKYEDILQKAEKVEDLLKVQQQLTNLQTQIDNLKGQQKYYDQSTKLVKITIYLSTDELTLPYTPTNEWRPKVIFKKAVRSLVGSFRGIGSLIIWVVAYLPIIIPLLLIIWFIKRKRQQKVC